METDIERMYRAGRIHMPNAAQKLSGTTKALGYPIGVFNAHAALAGDPPIMRNMLLVAGHVHAVLVKMVGTSYDAAGALIATADDFVKTDADARADFEKMDQSVKDTPNPTPSTSSLPQSVGTPEAPGTENGLPTTPAPVDAKQEQENRSKSINIPDHQQGR